MLGRLTAGRQGEDDAVSDEGRIRIGTSGWHYDHWRGPFYPSEMPAEGYLAHYAERFGTVEVNNTFYQLPDRSSVDGWRDTVGQGFRFAVKASRYITHMKKLSDPQEPIASFSSSI